MKKSIMVCIAVIMVLFTLAACSGGESELSNSLAYLKTASSYKCSYISFDGDTEKCYVLIGEDGKQTLVCNTSTYSGKDGRSFKQNSYIKHYCESGFRAEDMMLVEMGWNLTQMSKALKAIVRSNPKKATTDNGVQYTVEKVNAKLYVEVVNRLFRGDEPRSQAEILEAAKKLLKTTKVKFVVLLNGSGEFQELQVIVSGEEDGRPFENRTLTYKVSNVNGVTDINVPDFSDYRPKKDVYFVYWKDGKTEQYLCLEDAAGQLYMAFVGLGYDAFDDYTVESYTVRTEVEGLPVKEVRDVLGRVGNAVQVKRIVVPAGITFALKNWKLPYGAWYSSEQTEFYLNAPESAVNKATLSAGVQAKSVYYADQWQWVDGIPKAK